MGKRSLLRHTSTPCARVFERELTLHEPQRIFFIAELTVQLSIFDRRKNRLEPWTWIVACGDQVIAADQRSRTHDFRRNLRHSVADEFIRSQATERRQTIHAMQVQVLL